MKKVITYGTFDLFHYGHMEILRRAKALGDYLVVAVSSDEFNKIKGKVSVQDQTKRMQNVRDLRFVDEVILEENWEQKVKDIKDHNIDVFVMGDDWKGKFDDLPCEVVYLPRTQTISTTEIKKIINKG